MTVNAWRALLAVLFLFLGCSISHAESIEETYSTVSDFLLAHFESEPKPKMLWLKDEQRAEAEIISGEDPGFRQRYWRKDDRLVFVFDVIGRDHPITVAAWHLSSVCATGLETGS